jgi:alpha-tubulin suppressor-like RCC1 family protein
VGDLHACAVMSNGGQVYCWGDNWFTQIGTASPETAIATPVQVPGLTGIPFVSAGGKSVCAGGTTTRCWGANANGELGDGTKMRKMMPSPTSFGATTSMAGGSQFHCALTTIPSIVCAGNDQDGQIGDGGGADKTTPQMVAISPNPVGIAAGTRHACALLGNNNITCWGNNEEGQLGRGTKSVIGAPAAIAGTFFEVHSGGDHTCAINGAGDLACWGNNNSSELGDGTATDRTTPTTVAIPGAAMIAKFGVGNFHTCALRNGNLYCWGRNLVGELGDGAGIDRDTPMLIGAMNLIGIGAGLGFTCVLDANGDVRCWGDNNRGQIGQGTITRSFTPVEVTFP